MLNDAEYDIFDVVVVKDVSRFARNTVDLLTSIRSLRAQGINVLFVNNNQQTLGESEFVITLLGAMAQEESANTSKRVKFSKKINAEKGRVPNIVYGYNKTKGDYFNLTINETEAEVIRQMYRWYTEEGYGTAKIAIMLNEQGLKTKRNCKWSANAVSTILSNELYTGKIINGKQEVADFLTSTRVDRDEADWLIVEKPELRIIGDEQFQKACELMKSRNEQFHLNHKRQSNKYLFSTLIVCKACGWSFRRVTRTYKNTYIRWVCSKHNGQGVHNCPNAVTVDEEQLIQKLDEYFLTLLQDRTRVEQFLRRKLKEACRKHIDQDEQRKTIQNRLAKLEKQRKKYLELYADDLITRTELDEKLGGSKEEVARLEEELRQAQMADMTDGDVERIIQRVMEGRKDFVSVRRLNNALLKQLIEKIEVDEDGSVDVYLRLFSETEKLYWEDYTIKAGTR